MRERWTVIRVKRERRRSLAGSVIAGIIAVALLVPATGAVAAPTIALLNPSGYSATIRVNDAGGTFHFVAWVKEVPSNPLVEFEIVPTAGNAITINSQRVGSSEVWEAHDAFPPGLADGQYTINARLYSNLDEVAMATQTVTLERSDIPPPPGVPTVEISHPDNGGPLGFYTPTGGAANALIDVVTSDTNEQVRALYTTSAIGTAPTWTECGTAAVTGAGRVRCTLGAAISSSQVTAVAVVANQAPAPGPANPAFDGSGDAHRVVPYVQVPRSVSISPPSVSKAELAKCLELVARVIDTQSRPMAAVNMDIHASGPNDQLRFGTIANVTGAFQPPDKNHVSSENAVNCGDGSNQNKQGDHNVVNGNDKKHIESTTGTNNQGEFRFALRSDSAGGTFVEAWADVNNDDLFNSGEASGGSQIGWAQDPPQPQLEISLQPTNPSAARGSCQRMEAIAREGGNPIASQNIDVHASGPDASVSFCPVADGSPTRIPDAGDHSSGTHTDGTKHIEGETDSFGRFVFGVLSSTEGVTSVTAWMDLTDDDLFISEPSASGAITWSPPGERTISIDVNKSSVRKGGKVKVFGQVEGDAACVAGQTVKLKSRRPGRKFRSTATVVTGDDGSYQFVVTVKRTTEYRTVSPEGGPCVVAKSQVVKVKAS
jgi:hypothetical protein